MDIMRPFYDAARALYPLLPQWYELTTDGITPEFRGLNAGGLPVFAVPANYTLTADEGAHEAGHAYFALLGTDRLAEYWTFRGFPGTWRDAMLEALATTGNAAFQLDPRESWAEAFARSVVTTHNEKTMTYGKDMSPLLLRAFFTSLSIPSAVAPVVPQVVAPAPTNSVTSTYEWFGPVPGSNFMLGRDGNPITLIIVHWMAGTLASADARFKNPTQRVSAHYGISRDGRVIQWVSEDDTAYHAGDWTKNLLSIGIEHEASPTMPPTEAMYAASTRLLADISTRRHIPLIVGTTVLPHSAITPTACPGTLDLARIVGDDMDRNTFNAWFLEEYKAAGVAALFDRMKTIDAQLADQNRADDARDAAQQRALEAKADKAHPHTATTTVS